MCSSCSTTETQSPSAPLLLKLASPSTGAPPSTSFHALHADFVATIRQAVAGASADLRVISKAMYERPETAYEEVYAASLLCGFMEKQGFHVKRTLHGLKSAWSAELQVGSGGPTIGFNSEMDALPGLGHACGHQLIAISGCAAALGVAAALKAHSISGRVLLLGTPAEEKGGGKVDLLNAGAYNSMAACMMLHPIGAGRGAEIGATSAKQSLVCTFSGAPAHGAAAPHLGTNALDAAVLAYTNINTLRPSIIPDARMFGIIGGESTWVENIIPAHADLKYGIRAPTTALLLPILERVKKCMEAAALATGCKFEIVMKERYDDLQNSAVLGNYFTELGMDLHGYHVFERNTMASTDFGNVSYRIPALHPHFQLPDAKAGDHPHSTTYAAGTNELSAHEAALSAATSIAIVGLRVVADSSFRQHVIESWKRQIAATGRQ